jgi:hypothetical protein
MFLPACKLFIVLILILWISPSCGLFSDGPAEEDDSPDINTIQRNDIQIADTINQYILHRLRNGQFSSQGWGFPYSRPPTYNPWNPKLPFDGGCCRWTPFDVDGISLYAQHHRFKGLSVLAKERLQLRGYNVKVLEIFSNDRGIHLRWDIMDPMTVAVRGRPGDGGVWRTFQERVFPGTEGKRAERHVYDEGYFGGEYNFDGEELSAGKSSDGMKRLKHFLDDPWDFFVNG